MKIEWISEGGRKKMKEGGREREGQREGGRRNT